MGVPLPSNACVRQDFCNLDDNKYAKLPPRDSTEEVVQLPITESFSLLQQCIFRILSSRKYPKAVEGK